MRPALKAGLLALWRDRETVQIGVDPRRAVALTGMGEAALVLELLDGSRDRDQVIATAREHGIPEPVTDRIVTLLAAGGALDDFPVAAMRSLPQDERRRLAAELAAASLAYGHSDAGAAALARRHAARILVGPPGRVADGIAQILVASGIGGVATGDGRGADGRPVLPDLAILTGYQDPDVAARLMRAGVPHLGAAASEAIGVVGPLVRPGRTACLRCLDLTRASLDPAWPLILAQLAWRRPDPTACDAALAAAVAAQTAAQALAFIDRVPVAGPTENGTLELVLPAWQWRRRTWPRHPRCGCSADTAA